MSILQWLLQTDSGVVGLILRNHSGCSVLSSRRSENAWLVWRPWLQGNDEVFHELRDSRGVCAAGDCRRIPRSSQPRRRAPDACRCPGYRVRDARGYPHSSRVIRLVHELVR